MNAPERRCANPVCRDDISDLRADAVVCRRKACRSWRDRRRAQSLYSPCTRGCPERGWCERHKRFNRPPRQVSEATGGGGKRVRGWSDLDHAGQPGLWELWAESLPGQFPRFERTSKHYTPACRAGRVDRIEPAGLHPHDLSPSMGSGLVDAGGTRSGIEALRGLVDPDTGRARQPGLNVEVDQDGWVTIRPSGEPGLDVIDGREELSDEVELRRAA